MTTRAVGSDDLDAWAAMRSQLWPDADPSDLHDEAARYVAGNAIPTIHAVFVAEAADRVVGFIELAMRSYANGCDAMPVAFVEGWFVDADHRGRGYGRSLMIAAEAWAEERGSSELGSDAELHNTASHDAHRRCGFEETERVVMFRKRLTGFSGGRPDR